MLDRSQITVALPDTRWVGHHPTYFREFVASLRRLGTKVIALCPQPDPSTDPNVHGERLDVPHGSIFLPSGDNDPLSTVFRWWTTRRALAKAEQHTGWRADLIFFPYLDTFLRFLPSARMPDVLLGRSWSGLYFRNQHLGWAPNGPITALKRIAKGDRALRSSLALPSVGVLDERFDAALERLTGRSTIQFPDITDETAPAGPTELSRRIVERAGARPIVGLIGLEKRKGVLTMLRAARAVHASKEMFFVAARPFHAETFSPDELKWIKETAAELEETIFIDFDGARIPDGAEFNAVFQTFDVAWAAYEGFQGSSNTLTKAAIFDKPVLATAGECVGKRTNDFRLGLCAQEGNVADVIVTLRCLIRREGRDGRPLDSRFADYRRAHSRARLDQSFSTLLDQLPAKKSRS